MLFTCELDLIVIGVQLAGLAVVAGAAVELALRARVFDPTKPYVLNPGWQATFCPSSDGTPGIHRKAKTRINRLGLRGEVPRRGALPRVLTLGGSTTEDIMLEFADSWPGLLQSHLRRSHPKAWVGNAGKAGSNARHCAMQLETLLSRIAGIHIVVLLAGLNDLLYDFRIHHPSDLPPDWDRKQAFKYLPSETLAWYQRLATVELARRWLSALREDRKHPLVDLGAQIATYKLRRRAVRAEDFIRDVPDLSQPLTRFGEVLERIVMLVARHGAELVLVTQPAIWVDAPGPEVRSRLYAGGVNGPHQWLLDARNPWYHHTVLRRMLDSYNDISRAVCRRYGLICVDLAETMPKSAEFFYDDFHFSAAGSAFAAGEIAAVLATRCRACR
ncbi:MAG TPA: SGNH/GDSL hydrolase family protein [Hyphomicrobiaceae bacterium]|nr:SGNH/GDSL hydrolase family protein [Hyphomicrobiaceae bacterium]